MKKSKKNSTKYDDDENDIINNSKRLLGLAAFEKENRDKVISANERYKRFRIKITFEDLNAIF